MKRLLIAASIALLGVVNLAAAHEPTLHAPATAMEAADPAMLEVIAAVDALSAALKAGSLDRVGELLADDVLILENGGVEHSSREYLDGHAKHDAAFLKNARVEVKRRTARVEGDMAWVGTESELHTSKEGKPSTLLSTETMVLKKSASKWRIVHIHWSSSPKR